MKKFFGAIGRFFAKIWNWIKETAWVQPLLIVGLIFGVIFSIPAITKGIKQLQENGSNYRYINKNNILASELLSYESKYEDDAAKGLDEALGDANETSKFLICVVTSDNSTVINAEKGFKYLLNDEPGAFFDDDHKYANVKFLYQWEKGDEDDDDIKKKWRNDVNSYLDWEEKHHDEIEIAYKDTCTKYGKDWKDYGDDSNGSLSKGVLPTPAMILFEEGKITDVYFSVDGETKAAKAQFIKDFYFHEGDFDAEK